MSPQLKLRPHERMRSFGARPLRISAVIALVVVCLLPSIPIVVSNGDGAPIICECGCGNPKGRCCCSAPSASGLSFSCSQREDPNEPIDTTIAGKFIGPPDSIDLIRPMPAVADLSDLEFAFAGLGPQPETPPPRA